MGFLLKMAIWLFVAAVLFFVVAVYEYYNKSPKGAKTVDIANEVKKIANITENEIDSRKVYVIENKQKINDSATIIYFHGGAYVGGITKRHWNFIYKIVEDTQMKIIFPDYPLAPKYTYVDMFEFLDKLLDEYKDEKNFIFMGDSAGGGITLALTEKLQRINTKQPKKIILISPWLDITLKNQQILEKEKEDKILKKSVLRIAADMYSGENKEIQSDYLMSPINGELDNIKNIAVFTGTADILNPDTHILKEKIEKNKNIKFKFFEKENAIHNWIFEDLENSKEDYEEIVKEIINFK